MNTKAKYKTKQRKELQEYMETVAGKHITANDICEYFAKSGKAIGLATVYRNLESMVDEGLVNKYIIDTNQPACFEFIKQKDENCKENCFHCKCEKCGKLFHMHCEEIMQLTKHFADEHGFVVDPCRTVFYGLCKECSKTA